MTAPSSAGVCSTCGQHTEKLYGGMGKYLPECVDCWTAPTCAEKCKAVIRAKLAKVCESSGVPVHEVHITHVPPLIPTLYEDLQVECPHGVLWHMQPTSEQMAEWVRDGVE